MTNNLAEYYGLCEAMVWIQDNHAEAEVIFYGDSSLVISQMMGESRAKKGKYLPYYHKAMDLAKSYIERRLWSFRWIPREMNSEADELSQYYRF